MTIFGTGKARAQKRARAREHKQINEEYQGEAFFAGHKGRLIIDAENKIDRLEKEIEIHVRNMQRLMLELQNMPPSPAVSETAAEKPTEAPALTV